MKKTTRILCLAIAAVFVVSLLFSIAMSIAYAEACDFQRIPWK